MKMVTPMKEVTSSASTATGEPRTNHCLDCPYGGKAITSRGNPSAEIVIVGEAPGAQEMSTGRPFVGPSGIMLKRELARVGIDLEECYIANSLNCRPPKKKTSKELERPSPTAVRACNRRLVNEIAQAPRKLVIGLGGTALKSLTNSDTGSILASRGQAFDHPAGFTVLPTLHPAAVLRGGSLLPLLQSDLRYAVDIMEGRRKDAGKTEYAVVESDEEVNRAIDGLMRREYLACDIETATVLRTASLLCFGICWEKNKVLIFPMEVIKRHHARFKELFENPRIKWIFHNGKFDSYYLNREGFKFDIAEDTMLIHYNLDETPGTHGLKQLAAIELGANEWADELKPWLGGTAGGGKLGTSFQVIPREPLYKYLAADCDYTWQLWGVLRPRMEKDPILVKVYEKILIPASNFLREVESHGMWIDPDRVYELRKDVTERMAVLLAELREMAEEITKGEVKELNPNSPKQIQTVVFKHLRLKPLPEEKDNFVPGSTNKDNIDRMQPHPFTTKLLKYRRLAKALGTYIDGLVKKLNPDGRLRSVYLIHGTVTGRLSSGAPNLQNVTRYDPRDPEAVNVKSMFAAPPGRMLVEMDFSQAELRCLAALSGDPLLIDVYNNDRDLHDEVSLKMWGPNFSGEQRRQTKTLNFGVCYGLTAPNIAKRWRMPVPRAQKMIEDWFKIMPGVKAWLDEMAEYPRRGKPIRTPTGRLRRWGLIDKTTIHTLMNEARNAKLQPTASDMTLLAGILVQNELKRLNASVINLVHDSLVIECPDDPETLKYIVNYVQGIMEQVPVKILKTNVVPFKVDVKIGPNWGLLEAKDQEDDFSWVFDEEEISEEAIYA